MLVLFDVDGTLILTGGAGFQALARAFRELYGIEIPREGVRFGGRTDPSIIEEIFADVRGRMPHRDETAALISAYLRLLPAAVKAAAGRYRVMPGVARALSSLQGCGATVGLATGNVREGARIKLEPANLWATFPFGGFGCDSSDRATLVARAIDRGHMHAQKRFTPEEVWVVGDTPRDVLSARACGVRAAAVATGSYSAAELAATGADVVFETLEELPDWL